MGKITLKQAAAWCGGTVDVQYENVYFCGASNDTRTINPGELFIALEGARDGHEFIPKAMENGAAAVLCRKRVGDYPAIYVEDPRLALGRIAHKERIRLGMKTVAVTGSVGKSTTKEMIAQVLEAGYKTAKTPVNHNNDIGVPMAILAMPDGVEAAVLEMGMNHFGEISYLSRIGRPDAAVIVNIGTAHIEFLGSVEGIRKAKLEILDGLSPEGRLFLNGDDRMLSQLPEQPRQKLTYFGTGENCAIRATHVVSGGGCLRFTVEAGDRSFPVELPMEGMHFVADAMAAVAIGLSMGIPVDRIQEKLANFRNMEGRQEIVRTEQYTIIKDCYNAGPESMAAALNVLGAQKGRKIAVLGDMLELGDCAEAEHYRVGRIAAEKADMVFSLGPNGERVLIGTLTGGMPNSRTQHFEDRESLISALRRAAKPGDVLLFKGSRGMHMELIMEGFLKENT